MSVNDTWMPLYLGDYLADTMHLGAAQHGAYLLLLMHYWRNGPLPDDDSSLAAIARCDAKLWRCVGPVVRGFFSLAIDGRLHQKRMDRERDKWAGISAKRREAGRAGAQAKWKPNGSHPPPSQQPIPTAEQKIPWNAMRQPSAQVSVDKSVDKSAHAPVNAMKSVTTGPVDKMASATNLPSQNPGKDGKCQDFAITPLPLPSKKILTLPSEGESYPERAREPEPPEACPEATPLNAEAAAAALAVAQSLGKSLHRPAYAQGRPARFSRETQAYLMSLKRPKAAHLSPEALAAMPHRKQAQAPQFQRAA